MVYRKKKQKNSRSQFFFCALFTYSICDDDDGKKHLNIGNNKRINFLHALPEFRIEELVFFHWGGSMQIMAQVNFQNRIELRVDIGVEKRNVGMSARSIQKWQLIFFRFKSLPIHVRVFVRTLVFPFKYVSAI